MQWSVLHGCEPGTQPERYQLIALEYIFKEISEQDPRHVAPQSFINLIAANVCHLCKIRNWILRVRTRSAEKIRVISIFQRGMSRTCSLLNANIGR